MEQLICKMFTFKLKTEFWNIKAEKVKMFKPVIRQNFENLKYKRQDGFLRCQTPTSTVSLKVDGCIVNNGGCRIKSEE